jgi:hypothetical protein
VLLRGQEVVRRQIAGGARDQVQFELAHPLDLKLGLRRDLPAKGLSRVARPCRQALRLVALAAAPRGPVLLRALRRLPARLASDVIA